VDHLLDDLRVAEDALRAFAVASVAVVADRLRKQVRLVVPAGGQLAWFGRLGVRVSNYVLLHRQDYLVYQWVVQDQQIEQRFRITHETGVFSLGEQAALGVV